MLAWILLFLSNVQQNSL